MKLRYKKKHEKAEGIEILGKGTEKKENLCAPPSLDPLRKTNTNHLLPTFIKDCKFYG